MKVENRVNPEAAQIEGLANPDHDGKIVMVNLLRFRDKAEYPDGRDADISGREAYQRYGVAVSKLVEKLGGRMIYAGNVSFLMLGEVEDLWDQVALVEYPNRAALFAMATSPEYQEIAVHRDAGLAGQLNIETLPPGA